jgi:hypothetical protein
MDDEPGPTGQRRHPLRRLGGGDIDVGDGLLKERVPDGAARHPRFAAIGIQRGEDAAQQRILEKRMTGEVGRPVTACRRIGRCIVMTWHRDVHRDCESCRQWRPRCSVHPMA